MRYLAILLLVVSLVGCGKTIFYKINPTSGEMEKVAQTSILGNGCSIVTQQPDGSIDALIQHAGMSTVFGGTLRSIFSIVGSVFGATGQEKDELEAHEGCAGIFAGEYEPNGEGNTDAGDGR